MTATNPHADSGTDEKISKPKLKTIKRKDTCRHHFQLAQLRPGCGDQRPDSSIQAQMTATLAVECNAASDGDFQGLLGTLTTAVLGAVQDVGGVLAGAFTIACQVVTA